jgi:hypothetical protein
MKTTPEQQIVAEILAEVTRARSLFPGANATNAALVEEVGEVSKALMFEPWSYVRKECIQVATMAIRLALEGDATFTEWRNKKVHADGRRYGLPEHIMPEQPEIPRQP